MPTSFASALRTCVLAGAVASMSASGASTSVVDSSTTMPDGTRTLQQSIELPAPARDAWNALTTSEGWQSWAAPVAVVDFRLGGIIETSYNASATPGAPGNIRNQVVAYAPGRMFAIRNVQAPPNPPFDVATFQSLHTVVFVDPINDTTTRVTFTQPGYRSGEPYDTVYKHFAWGNAWSLEQLKTRFVSGPIDWKKRAEQAAARSAAKK